jgi:hypothetical protein
MSVFIDTNVLLRSVQPSHPLIIVKPETVTAWHRRGFRLFWTWKSRRRAGRQAPRRTFVFDLLTNLPSPLLAVPEEDGWTRNIAL